MYQPLSIYLNTMENQCQDVDVVQFLLGLKLEYESVHAWILGGLELPSLSLSLFFQIQRATLFDTSS
jgi:hypothetical protein